MLLLIGINQIRVNIYHDLLAKNISELEREEWLTYCFDLAELAVHPLHQNDDWEKIIRLLGNFIQA